MPATDPKQPLAVALLGAGIFATSAHAPVLRKFPNLFQCKAVWSRNKESASKLANQLGAEPYGGETELIDLLSREDVEAVIISLPLDVQPAYVIQALQAGKKVLSEKPIAATLSKGSEVLSLYREKYSSLQWSVGENYRFEPALIRAAEAVKTSIGSPFLASLTIRAPFRPDNKYLNTPWRNMPSWYGGLIVDCFVHASAMLRLVVGIVDTVSAKTFSNADYLPGMDTMVGHAVWKNGVSGAFSVTYACVEPKYELEVTGTEGSVLLQRRLDGPGYKLRINKETEVFSFGGLEAEFIAFARACEGTGPDKNTPEEALSDIALVEACLESGKNGGAITKVRTF